MTHHELNQKIDDFQVRIAAVLNKKDLPKLKSELAERESVSKETNFWNDNSTAQKIMQEIGLLQKEIENLEKVNIEISNLVTDFRQLGVEDTELLQLITEQVVDLEKKLSKLELSTFLSGKYDVCDAILSIYAGQGGTEACDWTSMLLRMYVRYCESQGWQVHITDELPGTEAGLQSVTLKVSGKYSYGYLKFEHGTHRLVRNSPFNSAGLRQTSFAGVEVSPLIDESIQVDIKDEDLEFSAVRSSGAGGQNVNKVATSVRIVHKPTGIAVTSSTSRFQVENRRIAMQMLKSKLYKIEQDKIEAEKAGLKGEYKIATWGNQIRNYVLQPYKLVKDVRTEVETSQADAVLGGDLEIFIEAEVRNL